MSEPIRNNKDILGNNDAFQAAYQRAREYFLQFDGVMGIGFGQKSKDGKFLPDICIVVFVKEKKETGQVPADQLIPPYFEGYPTDVMKVQQGRPLACTGGDAEYDHMMGGIQVCVAKRKMIPDPAHPGQQMVQYETSLGTMSCIVRRRGDTDRTNVYLLSNHHVLFGANGANDSVYHPYPDGTGKPSTTLGPVQNLTFYSSEAFPAGSANTYFVDCAIARIDIDCTCWGTHCTKDQIKYNPGKVVYQDDTNTVHQVDITDIRNVIADTGIIGQKVYKYGSVTKRTAGFVRHVNTTVNIFNDDGSAGPVGYNSIGIEFDTSSTSNGLNCAGNPCLAEEGDSGSPILDEQGRIIGILFLGPHKPIPNPLPAEYWFCHACHILPVIDKMNICIPVTGAATTHGTCAATDGSGVTPPPPQPANPATTIGGSLGTINLSAKNNGFLLPGIPQPEPLTEEQLNRLNDLLGKFRTSRKGREMHAAFGHVRREIGYLIRRCRPATVAWHRGKGPAFFACLLNHLSGDRDDFPHEINGARLSDLLDKMETVLLQHGSHQLQRVIKEYGNDIRPMLLNGNNVREFISYLEKTEKV